MISAFEVDFYHPSRCQICKTASNLKTCANCKSISYCSKEHQALHWPKHKYLCKLITETEVMIPADTNLLEHQDQVVHLQWTVLKIWQLILKRNTTIYEQDLLYFRRNCMICNSRNCKIQCEDCLSAFYCCLEHQKIHENKHKAFCALLKLNFDLLLFNYKNMLHIPKFSGKNLQDLKQLPENLRKLAKVFIEESYISFGKEIQFLAEFSIVDNLFAPVANIIFGLEKGNLLNNRFFIKSELIVHIIGADEVEGRWNWNFIIEFLLHWMENVNKVNIFCIGPEAISFIDRSISITACKICEKKYSLGGCTPYPTLYHEVADILEKPDIIVGFNCGLFVFPSWIESIPSITKHNGIPLVFTDYRMDWIEKDIEIIRSNTYKQLDILLSPQKNPFSCISPERSLEDKVSSPIIYKNEYITVLVTK